MGVSLNVNLKQTQKLVMTQSLKQAIELLQLSTLELSERISEEIQSNPVIEEAEGGDTMPLPDASLSESGPDMANNLNGEEAGYNEIEEHLLPYDDLSDTGYANRDDEDRKRKFFENAVASAESLSEHLLWQARLTAANDLELSLFQNIITSLDETGYLRQKPEDFIDSGKWDLNAVTRVIGGIQLFDPVGCASSSLPECLRIQARYYHPSDSVLQLILTEYFTDLEHLDYEKIAKSLNLPVTAIIEKSKIIQMFDPFPGRQYSSKAVRFIIPDVEVRIVDGAIFVNLNDDWVPSIRINSYYINYLKKKNVEKKLREYIQDKVQAARYLIRNISSRRETIIKVVRAIMENQGDFLLRGPGNLKPLTHIDIAGEIGMHESTVSRVTSNKFVQTSWGVFELKYFFVSKLKTSNANEEQSSDNAMKLIKDIISTEKPDKPFSDEEIVTMLEKAGIRIARRTIAKYRDILHIPSSSRRKKLNLIKAKGNV